MGALVLCVGLSGVPDSWARQAGQAARARQSGEGDEAPRVDHVNLAAMLMRDGHHDRAESILQRADVRDPKLDRMRYHLLYGLLHLRAKRYARAIRDLDQAIAHGMHEDSIFVYLAQCHFHLQQWQRTITAVDNAGADGAKLPQLLMMKVQAQLKLDREADAWETLEAARARHPQQRDFARQQVFLLIRLGLYQEATRRGAVFLEADVPGAPDPEPSDFVAMALAFKAGGQLDPAKALMEEAALRFPDDHEVITHLAHLYLDAGEPLAAADLLQRVVHLSPDPAGDPLRAQSAELFKRAGAYERALFMNAQLNDQRAKFKQRAAILLDRQEFEAVVALAPRLERLGLLEEQSVVYALAYARFKIRDYPGAERMLKRITDPQLFRHATQLREVIARCAQNPDACQ